MSTISSLTLLSRFPELLLLGILGPTLLVKGSGTITYPRHAAAIVDGTGVQSQSEGKKLNYDVTTFFIPTDKKRFTLVYVTLEPSHFNRRDLMMLAHQLNNEYAQTSRLRAALFDDDSIPRIMKKGGVSFSDFRKAQRGLYYIDRINSKEYIQFSTRRGRPWNEVTIDMRRPDLRN